MQPKVYRPMAIAEVVLKEAKQILDRLGLVFFLRHGTCLGAVRDKAFIEWDDDLDIGSVIGLHGLTEELVHKAAEVFKGHGFDVKVEVDERYLSVDMKKTGTSLGWTCYRIIEDSIYQFPGVRIPASLHADLKEIDFFGEKFMVPNLPEEYFRFKYGPDWMTPTRAGGFEQGVLDLIAETTLLGEFADVVRLANEFEPERHTGSLKVLDLEGRRVEGAEISLAATSVLTGLHRSKTNKDGFVYFGLPVKGGYILSVQIGDHGEFLYSEHLEPDVDYVYKPDPEFQSVRFDALVPVISERD
jgi:lipopolysaccharide cholinephosphotransferase